MKVISSLGLGVGTIALAVSLSGCGKESTPKITLSFGGYTASNPLLELLLPSAHAALSNTKLCLKRLRFKQEDSAVNSGSDNVDFAPGLVTLSSTGSSIGEVTLTAGTYKRVEFDLEKDCLNTSTPYSVQGANDNGDFTSDATITIKFHGTFEAEESGQVLSLGTQAIVNALNGLGASPSSSEVKTALEAASGTF
ncbi:MAG: hypothetical protein NDJ89_13800 [Oligoflexia bacterium]|nr:hypothetical protein [Oligoflexia bacterium]